MAGTIVVSTGVSFDVRTIDFAWLVGELRGRMNDSNRALLATVLGPHDEHGMDLMVADELDSAGLRQFSDEIGSLRSRLRSSHGESGLIRFLEEVQATIHSDPRSAG